MDRATLRGGMLQVRQAGALCATDPRKTSIHNRSGGIRSALAADLKTINSSSPETYDALPSQIDKQLVFIEQNCRLNPQAPLHIRPVLLAKRQSLLVERSKAGSGMPTVACCCQHDSRKNDTARGFSWRKNLGQTGSFDCPFQGLNHRL